MSTPTTTDAKTTAVATREEGGLERFRELRDLMSVFPPEKFIRLLPSTFQEPSTLFRPVPAAIKVNPEDERDVYPMPGSRVRKLEDVGPDGKVCLHTTALERIGGLMGIRWLGTTYDRDPREPHFVTAHVRAEWTDALGERIPLAGSATCDYREGSIGAKLLGGGLDTARQFIAERSEARARNRIVRKVTGMPSSFTKRELLEKAFVAVRWTLDERQPDVRKALIERGTRAAGEVFGRRGEAVDVGSESAADEFSGEPIDTRGGSSEMAATPSREERSGPTGEVAGSSPAPRSAQVDPDPVEEESAKPAVDQERAQAIRAHVESVRAGLRWGKGAREKRPTAAQAGASVSAIVAALTSTKGQLNVEQKKAVWRAVTEFVFGPFGSYEELNSDQVSTLIDFSKEFPGEIQELVTFLAQSNERIAEIDAALHGQQELVTS